MKRICQIRVLLVGTKTGSGGSLDSLSCRFFIRRRFIRGEPPNKKRQDGGSLDIKTPLNRRGTEACANRSDPQTHRPLKLSCVRFDL